MLNFNYKFRSITAQDDLNSYDNIRIQTDKFDDVKMLKSFIDEITGTNQLEIKNIDIDSSLFKIAAAVDPAAVERLFKTADTFF